MGCASRRWWVARCCGAAALRRWKVARLWAWLTALTLLGLVWLLRWMTTLAPDIVAAILDDALPDHITLFDLAVGPPALWDEQLGRVRLWGGNATSAQ